MISVALIGLDGAGKTTVAEVLADGLPFPAERVYMGTNLESSNVLLPTSRLLRFLRRRRLAARLGGNDSAARQARALLSSNRDRGKKRGTLRAAAGLVMRLAESAYRTIRVGAMKWSGIVVLCDRHLYFENLSRKSPGAVQARNWPDRVFLWCTERVLPRPDLVLFLDVPAEVAHRRKPEMSVEEFDDRRRALCACAAEDTSIIVIDAAQPLETVVRRAAGAIESHIEESRRTAHAEGVSKYV